MRRQFKKWDSLQDIRVNHRKWANFQIVFQIAFLEKYEDENTFVFEMISCDTFDKSKLKKCATYLSTYALMLNFHPIYG